MVAIKSVVHFSIPVSDVGRSTRFYTEIVGCRHLATVAAGTMAFLDAAGTCLILVKREPPINARPEGHGGVHHSFAVEDYAGALDHLRARGVEITFEKTARAASSTARVPISTTPTAPCWNSST
ncbi:MAG TPA: VOC family protein [Stellaceae bacterium]|nr:VOC family protein [Stellaceae bacterium]